MLSTTLNMTRLIRAKYSSARPDKHYGETCHQNIIQSGLRQNFNYNLEGVFRLIVDMTMPKFMVWLWYCQLQYIILNDN